MDNHRKTHRQPIDVVRNCALGVISFKELAWSDHVVRLVDLSKDGVGIEATGRIEPGFVWFRERVGGYKGGVLLWSKHQGQQFRGGIRFVELTADEERYIEEPGARRAAHKPRRSPEEIITQIVRSMTKNDRTAS